MPEELQNLEVHINIKQLRLISFKITDTAAIPPPDMLKIAMQQVTHASEADLTITLDLKVFLSNQDGVVFMEAESRNVFTISELPRMMVPGSPEQINIPDNIFVTLLSISISHTRALMSQGALGTKFQDVILPIVNPGNLRAAMVPQQPAADV